MTESNARNKPVFWRLLADTILDKEILKDVIEKKAVAIILAVPHDAFLKMNIQTTPNSVVYDLKGVLPKSHSDKRL